MSRQLKQAMRESDGQSKPGKALLSLKSLQTVEDLSSKDCCKATAGVQAWHTWDAGTDRRPAMKTHQTLSKRNQRHLV